VKIVKRTNQDKDFYTLLGPFLAKRNIEKEIGYKIYDDDEKVWFIAIEMRKIIGFCYLQKKANHYQIGSCYVVEEYRQKGIFRELFTEATKGIQGNVTLTTKNENLRKMLIEEGFEAKNQRGGFTEYAKEYV
jgi:hypothetical protein